MGIKTLPHPSLFPSSFRYRVLEVKMNRPLGGLLGFVLLTAILAGQAVSQDCTWTSAGPTNVNGRITGIAINPNFIDADQIQIFVTSVGGVWRSDNGGRRWKRLSDEFIREARMASSVVINPAHTNQVFVGGGDPQYRDEGGGIWASDDSGEHWRPITELGGTLIIRLRIDPSIDPAAPHDLYAATPSGVYVGTDNGDGSRSWSRLGDLNAAVSDVVVDFSSSPRKVYAAVFEETPSFARGIWKYERGRWDPKDSGIDPKAEISHTALAISQREPNILYAKVAQRGTGRLLGAYKTTTGGDTWTALPGELITDSHQSDYNNVIEVDPNDSSIVWAGDVACWRLSRTGVWENVRPSADRSYATIHEDDHAIAFDPRNSKVVFVGTDGGLFRSTDTSLPGWHWNNISHGMVITELYGISSQQALVTLVAGGAQDTGVNLTYGNRTWYNAASCDGQFNGIAIDAGNSSTIHLSTTCASFETVANPVPYSEGGGASLHSVFPHDVSASLPITSDLALSGAALTAGVLASGGSVLLKTRDALNWSRIGPTFPADAIKVIAIGPPSVTTPSFRTYYLAVYDAGLAKVWRTFDEGRTWGDSPITLGGSMGKEPSGLAIESTDHRRAFVTVGRYYDGVVLLTIDGGTTWQALSETGGPALPSTGIRGIVIHPFNPNVIYIATALGVYKGSVSRSASGGFNVSWEPFNQGIPEGIDVQGIWSNPSAGLLYIGTHGYGAYERNIRRKTCPSTMLVVRDSVLDRGFESPHNVPDPEHPIPDESRPGFYKPDDTAGGRLYWWQSTDIRIDVPSAAPAPNKLPAVDSVEFESCPVDHARCDPGTMIDSYPRRGQPATAYVQVTNRGTQPSEKVRVILLRTGTTAGLPLLPADFWTRTFPAGSSTPCGPLSPGTGWNLVDPSNPCRTIEAVNPMMPEVVGFDWFVDPETSEHPCMIAIIESDDDPIPDEVRLSIDPGIIAPEDRHIAVRNLHVIDGKPDEAVGGSSALSVPNPSSVDQRPIDLYLSKAGMPAKGKLAVLLPPLSSVSLRGVKRVRATLSATERRKFARLGLDTSWAYKLTKQEGVIAQLAIFPRTTWTIGLLYNTVTKGRPNSAARFTVLARQGTKLLGGSTYILRYRAK